MGVGHGHFCCVVWDVWSNICFDALDLSESVDEVACWGWADHGHWGLFFELVSSLGGIYDVVSMSHYLEYMCELIDEIKVVYFVFKEGGMVFIEIFDPDCFMGWFLGRWWLFWFQP